MGEKHWAISLYTRREMCGVCLISHWIPLVRPTKNDISHENPNTYHFKTPLTDTTKENLKNGFDIETRLLCSHSTRSQLVGLSCMSGVTPAKQIIKAGVGRAQLQRITSHTRWHDDLQDKGAGSLTTDVFILYLTFASKQLPGHDARTGSFQYEHTQKGESLNKMRFLLASHESNEQCLLSMQKHKTRI